MAVVVAVMFLELERTHNICPVDFRSRASADKAIQPSGRELLSLCVTGARLPSHTHFRGGAVRRAHLMMEFTTSCNGLKVAGSCKLLSVGSTGNLS